MIVRLIIGTVSGIGLGALMGYFGKCASGACPLTATPLRGAIYGAVMGALFALSFATSAKTKHHDDKVVPAAEQAKPAKELSDEN